MDDILKQIEKILRRGKPVGTAGVKYLEEAFAYLLDNISDGGGAVESVNGMTGEVVLDASDVGAATSVQGALADTAVQPSAIEDMVESEDISTIVALTQTAYDAIPVPDANTFYIITGP